MTIINSPVVRFDPSNMSAFGTLETAELTPLFQGDFVYGLNTQMWNTPVVSGTGATVDTNLARLRIQSGTGSAGYAYVENKRPLRYRAGQGTIVRFTPIFTAGVANNIQIWGVGDLQSNVPYDGYFFGYNGTSFGIAHYNRGTPTWYTQTTDWNGDKVDGSAGTSFTYNPALGTPCQIKYPYLGYGDIEFFMQVPTTGRWTLVHVIRYANTLATTQLSNPTMNFFGFTLNSGNTTNQIMYCGSVGIFISGNRTFIGNPRWAMDRNRTTVTTEICLLNIRNATTYNGVLNQGIIRLNQISFASSVATSVATLRMKTGATIGGSPSYTTINGTSADGGITITAGNSIASYDTAGTTVSGGNYIFNMSIGGSGQASIDITEQHIYIAPGEILSITGTCTNSATLGVSLNWSEDI